MGTPEGLFSPDYLTRDVPRIVAALNLDDLQREIVAQVLQDYDESFGLLLEGLRSQTEAIRDGYTPDPEIEESMDFVRERMGELRAEARAQFGRRGRGGDDRDDAAPPEGDERPELSPEERRAQQEALRDQIRSQFDDLRREMEGLRARAFASDQMQAMLEARISAIRAFASSKQSLRDSTVDGIRALLVESQAEFWPAIERTLRRQRVLGRGRLSGESTDLLDVVADLRIEDAVAEASLQEVLLAYEVDLDRSLRAREDYDFGPGLDLVDRLHERDFEGAVRSLRKRLAIQEATRSVNDRYIEQITMLLPVSIGDSFRLEALRRGYQRIFRPTRGERALMEAMTLEDLEPDILLAVAELMEAHSIEIEAYNNGLLAILRAEEVELAVQRAQSMMQGLAGDRGRRDRDAERRDPVREGFDQREAIDDRYLQSLEALLGVERFEAVAGRRGRGGDDRRPQSREEFIKAFDANGDGELDDAERAAAREAMRSRTRGDRPGRRGGRPPREL